MESSTESKNYAKRYRQKLKSDSLRLEISRERARERAARYRKKLVQSKENKMDKVKERMDKVKEQNRKRQQQFRLKKNNEAKNKVSPPVNQPYKCKQTLGKAVCKAKRALPVDPEKRAHIVDILYGKYGTSSSKQQSESATTDKKQFIKDFYLRDDISIQAPGKKDTLIVNGEIVPKRFMLLTVSESYELYKTERSIDYVGKSVFYELRPKYVQLSCKIPHNMCVCQYHANFAFILTSIAEVITSFSPNFETFLKSVCCNIENEQCMTSNCRNCVKDVKNDLVPLKYFSLMDKSMEWKHWRKVEDRIALTHTEGSLSDLLYELDAQLPFFKRHFFVKRSQQYYFEMKKRNIMAEDLVLQIDFAENYRLIFQNEVQSAHFTYRQVTIFTCVAWLIGGVKSYAIISDKLTHNKFDVCCFLTKLVKMIKKAHGQFQNIYVFSDGCSFQFKNKFIARSLPDFVSEFGCKVFEWNYFATSHGKGAVDGVGATIKRKVWQMTKTKNLILENAFSFYECARSNIIGVNLIYISSEEVDKFSTLLTEKWKELPQIRGIHQIHFLSSSEDMQIKVARTAFSSRTII